MNNSIDTDKPNIRLLSYLFYTGKANEIFFEKVMEHFKLKELILDNGYRIHKDKINELVVDYEQDGYCDSIGLGLALTINNTVEDVELERRLKNGE